MQPLSDHFTNVPAFLTKLWKMVSDPKTDHLICWGSSGNSFIILNQVQFWYELLPLYYKHNNMSSFVRQLNMYGFHKVSSVENGSLADGEKDEVQFFHMYFQKGSPELLKLIKRKVTVSKHTENTNQLLKGEDLSKVLSDVKQLRGRQASVDSQLAAMKQENAVLWRELAVLRQKHTKQQQIVNKLIQFLVSMVHPGNNGRMGVGVKRHYPLMLRGTPSKKARTSKSSNNKNKNEGPTIHELDNEIEQENGIEPEVLLSTAGDTDKDLPLICSPLSPPNSYASLGVVSPLSNIDLTNELINEAENLSEKQCNVEESSSDNNKESYWNKPSFVSEQFLQNNAGGTSTNELLADEIADDPILNILEDNIINDKKSATENRVFISPSSQDTLLSNLGNGNYNTKALSSKKSTEDQNNKNESTVVGVEPNDNAVSSDMIVATRKSDGNGKINGSTDACFSNDLGFIVDNNQSEIDLYKDLLHGCGTLDTNTLLGVSRFLYFTVEKFELYSRFFL
ncbi:hypothetical protein HHI36_023042 [Cryptolaemus montrouzieri]|uniref:HSF-type DNA-binding domain-containing protein n=1 Tax=Cryptolaemus montrouzieri TaxID=559131 RepID=A0ABD2PF52_9CUCU